MSMVLMTSSKVLIALMVLLLLHDVTCKNKVFGVDDIVKEEDNNGVTTREPQPDGKDPSTMCNIRLTEILQKLDNQAKKLDNQAKTLQKLEQQDTSTILNTYCTTRFQTQDDNLQQLKKDLQQLQQNLNILLPENLNSSGEKNKEPWLLSDVWKSILNWHVWKSILNWHVWKSILDAKTISDFWVVEILVVLIIVYVLWRYFGIINFFCACVLLFWKFFAWLGTKEAPKAEEDTAKATKARNAVVLPPDNGGNTCQNCGKLRSDSKVLIKDCMEPHGDRVGNTAIQYYWYLNQFDKKYGQHWMDNGVYSAPMRKAMSGN